MKIVLLTLATNLCFISSHYAMQEVKMNSEIEYADTETIEIQLHHDVHSKDSKAKNFTLNLNIKKNELYDLANNEEVRTLISGIVNKQAQNLKIVQLQDIKQYFRTPKPQPTHKTIILFAYEISNSQP